MLLTGASSGIGAEVARRLASDGHALALVARRADRLEQLASELLTLGASTVIGIPADLAEGSSLPMIVETTVSGLGGIDVLINNAGIGLPVLFAGADPELLRRQIEVNFTAPLLLTRLALPHLAERRGTVINIGSAITAFPNPVLGAYGATKAGLAWWTEALRHEVRGLGIRVCLVEPGPIATEFFRAVEALSPSDLERPMTPPIADAMTGDARTLARRIVGLLDRPKARISYKRRFVWPWRVLSVGLGFVPFLRDAAMDHVLGRIERESGRSAAGMPVGGSGIERGS